MLLTGSYRRNLDEKARLAIPKQLREAIGFPDNSSLYITPGLDQALEVYTADVLDQVSQKLAKLSHASKEMRAFSRLFFAQAQPAEIDKQGRMRIPAELAQLAKLSDEVVVVGVRDRIEIWNASVWDAFLESTQPTYDELAESVFGKASEPES